MAVAALALVGTVLGGGGGVPAVIAGLTSGDVGPLITLGAAAVVVVLVAAIVRARAAGTAANEVEAPDEYDHLSSGEANIPESLVLLDATTGAAIDIGKRRQLKAQYLVFVRPGCGACITVTEYLAEHEAALNSVVDVSIIAAVAAGGAAEFGENPDHGVTAFDVGDHVASIVGVESRRPTAALITTSGQVLQPVANGRDQVIELTDVLLATAEPTTEAAS